MINLFREIIESLERVADYLGVVPFLLIVASLTLLLLSTLTT